MTTFIPMERNSEQVLTEWLVIQIQSGDADALTLLLKNWYPKLLRYSSHQLQNQESAKDVVQETYINISQNIMKLKDPAAFPKWIYQVLHRRGVDYIRSELRNRRNKDVLEGEDEAIDDENIHLSIDVHKALVSLQDNSYQLVHLYYLQGFKLKEIAEITNIPEGTVKSRLHTARNQLKQLLEGESHE